MTLNKGQQEAADYFFETLFKDDENEIAISGGAGKGKTFLLGHLVDNIIPNYHKTCKLLGVQPKYNEVIMTATTNKAAQVLELATGKEAKTVHSFFNLVVKENWKTGQVNVRKTPSFVVHTNKIIFIDEAYFMDSILYNYIQEGTHNCKIVYVGDADQMAPIKERICPIADPDRGIKTYYLTQPMRNAGKPDLVKLCDQLKENVTTKEWKNIQTTSNIHHLNNNEATDKVEELFQNHTNDSRILCFHNRRVKEFNDYIRYVRGLPQHYQEGEILVSNTAYRTTQNQMLSVDSPVNIVKILDTKDISINGDDSYKMDVQRLFVSTPFFPQGIIITIPQDKAYAEQLSKYFAKHRMWPYYFYLKNNFPDLRPRDACTVYKAQGSTLKNVIIDLTDISSCGVPDTVARLLSVAVSRATDNVFFVGELAPKFGKILPFN